LIERSQRGAFLFNPCSDRVPLGTSAERSARFVTSAP
jgi:hypothetical protein